MTTLENILTGDTELDDKIRQAYDLGLKTGKINFFDNMKTQLTTDHLWAVIRNLHVPLETTMVAFQIPRSERKQYRKIITTRLAQKEAAQKAKEKV